MEKDKTRRVREGQIPEHLDLARDQVEQTGDPWTGEEVSPQVAKARQRAAREKQERGTTQQ